MQTMPTLRGVNDLSFQAAKTARNPLPENDDPRTSGGDPSPSARLGMTASFEAYAYSKPARTFTGDFYLTHHDTDRLWFVLGDVAGKGLNAAVIMAMIQEELEHRIASCATTKCDPSTTMQRLHEFLHPLMPRNRFATVVIGTLRDDGMLTITNAGHCPPLIVSNGVVEEIGSTGPVAGMLRRSRWHSVTRQMNRGDTLLIYSDGLIEAHSCDGEELGVDRVECAFIRAANCSPREIVDAVLADAADHSFDDDVTVLAITARLRPRAS